MTKDRLIKVQNAANEALRLWVNLKKELESLETKKMTRDVIEHNPDELIKMRTGIDMNQEGDIGRMIENMNSIPNDQGVGLYLSNKV
jgi:hypothetical protein